MSKIELPSSITSYKPEILKIRIEPFRFWIERRLTDLLAGLEDEILFSLVFNYLEDAHKRAKREGPAANPSGSLSATEIFNSLTGFLGQKVARDFVVELFNLLREAQDSPDGIPAEWAAKEAESAAFGIIEGKRKEMELSDRVRREVKRARNHERDRQSPRRYERTRNYDRHGDSRGSRHYEDRSPHHYDRHRNDKGPYHYDEHRDSRTSRDYDDRRETRETHHYDRHRDGRSPHKYDRHRSDRNYDRGDDQEWDRRDYRDDRDRRRHHSRSRSRDRSHEQRHPRERNDNSYRRERNRITKSSPIPSSSSSDSPSPCWETSLNPSITDAPRAPIKNEHVPNELEQALRAKALKAQKKEQ